MSEKGRVLFLARHLDSGGVTTHMMTLARGLQSRGWQVALASSGATGEHAHGPLWFEMAGVRHFEVPFAGPPAGPAQAPALLGRSAAAMVAVDRAVRAFKPSVMHVHWRSTSPFAAVEASLRGIPFVSTLHLDGIPAKGLFRLGSRWGSRVIAISRETRDYLVSGFGVDEDRVQLVFNGVDTEKFRPATPAEKWVARQGFGLAPDTPVLCLIGRLEKVKGHRLLFEATRRLKERLPGLQLLLAGEGSARDELQVLAESLGLSDRAHFIGYANTRAVLWASDALVLPSYQEGFPVVVVEAMLCGLPVVRTPAAGASDQVVDGVTGFIVPFDDDATLADRVERLLTDGSLARSMSGAALARATERFSLEQMARAVERIYLEISNDLEEA